MRPCSDSTVFSQGNESHWYASLASNNGGRIAMIKFLSGGMKLGRDPLNLMTKNDRWSRTGISHPWKLQFLTILECPINFIVRQPQFWRSEFKMMNARSFWQIYDDQFRGSNDWRNLLIYRRNCDKCKHLSSSSDYPSNYWLGIICVWLAPNVAPRVVFVCGEMLWLMSSSLRM